jgi:signal transduction histidine kinase
MQTTDTERLTTSHLRELLWLHREDLASVWTQTFGALPWVSTPSHETPDAATTNVADILIEMLLSGSASDLAVCLERSGIPSLSDSGGASNVLPLLQRWREALFALLTPLAEPNGIGPDQLAAGVSRIVLTTVAALTEVWTRVLARELDRERARAGIVLEMARIAAAPMELNEILARVAKILATVAGAEHSGFLLLDEAENVVAPRLEVTVPAASAALGRFIPVARIPVPTESFSAVFREVVEERRPVTCYDVQTDSRFDGRVPRSLGFRSLLAVPFVVRGHVVAVAYAVTSSACHEFTDAEVAYAQAVADCAAPAIDNGRLYLQLEQRAVARERTRLSREIHDSLAQTMGALQLQASLVEDLLADGQLGSARDELVRLRETVHECYIDVREQIFNLRTPVPSGAGFLAALREYLDDYQRHYDIDVDLQIPGEGDVVLSRNAHLQVIRVLQEALTNVRRHALVGRASICVSRVDHEIRVSVVDEGQGFDPDRRFEPDGESFGLQVMQERAASIGGRLEIISSPGRGTMVELHVPAN